jgi:threonine/homoserine/homoserine lactone efflux protein
MTSVPAFLSAVFLLLAVPGPTNTLLFLSGAASGLVRSLKLLLAEAGGYMSVVLPVAILAAPLLDGRPWIAITIKSVAAAWVLFMAYKLWTRGGSSAQGSVVSLRTMYVTTLLNPKAMIVGLVLIPHGTAATVLPWAALFLLALVLIAVTWISAGALTNFASSDRSVLPVMCRVAAICLVVFSGVMLKSVGAALGVV